ncbi:helix-turn-helix transcriptional regulator [Clostridium gelidum]|nr:helix-turn-helix transcriptional regulator [Clostridium gelidum]
MVFNLNMLNSAVTDGCLIKYFAPLLNNEHQLPLIIKENYMENISIKDMCSICNFSEYHFMRFFKKYIGMTCIGYINTYRLQIASKFLDTTDKSIMDISFEVGFNNLFRF